LSLQPAGTRTKAVGTSYVGESIALGVGITSGHAVSVGAACLSVGVGALSAVGAVVDGVDVTGDIGGRSSCRGARGGSSLCGELGSISCGNVSIGTGNNNVESITHLAIVVGVG